MPDNEPRAVILARIRSALTHLGDDSVHNARTFVYQQAGLRTPQECLELFIGRLREYEAEVLTVNPSGIAAAIGNQLRAAPSNAVPWVIADGFPAEWLSNCPATLSEIEASVDNLNSCAGVVTTCTVGIAVTGTLVLQHGPGEGRRHTTLLPDRHLCVIRSSQLVETVPEAFARLADAATRPLTFISGPSATADIEMTRIRGVHGPRQLGVILVQD